MPFFLYDPTIIMLIPALLFAFWAQMRIKSAYSKYGKIRSAYGLSGAQVAERILQQNGIYDVEVRLSHGSRKPNFFRREIAVGHDKDGRMYFLDPYRDYYDYSEKGVSSKGMKKIFHVPNILLLLCCSLV